MTGKINQSLAILALTAGALATLRLAHAQQPSATGVLTFPPPPMMRLRTPQLIVDSLVREVANKLFSSTVSVKELD